MMTPPNEHTSEGGRDDRGVPYHAESTLSSAQVLKIGSTGATAIADALEGNAVLKKLNLVDNYIGHGAA